MPSIFSRSVSSLNSGSGVDASTTEDSGERLGGFFFARSRGTFTDSGDEESVDVDGTEGTSKGEGSGGTGSSGCEESGRSRLFERFFMILKIFMFKDDFDRRGSRVYCASRVTELELDSARREEDAFRLYALALCRNPERDDLGGGVGCRKFYQYD